MTIVKTIRCFLTGLALAGLLACAESRGIYDAVLKEESAIIENYQGRIQKLSGALKEAENNNRLQNQLDLKRELDGLVSDANNALRDCYQKHKNSPDIPFSQIDNSSRFKVREIKIGGCSFNSEIMDFQVQLIAFATAKENAGSVLVGELCDFKGKSLKTIEFKMTDDFPETGKQVLLIAHVEGEQILKNFSNVKFISRGI